MAVGVGLLGGTRLACGFGRAGERKWRMEKGERRQLNAAGRLVAKSKNFGCHIDILTRCGEDFSNTN